METLRKPHRRRFCSFMSWLKKADFYLPFGLFYREKKMLVFKLRDRSNFFFFLLGPNFLWLSVGLDFSRFLGTPAAILRSGRLSKGGWVD